MNNLTYIVEIVKFYYRRFHCRRGHHRGQRRNGLYITAGYAYYVKRCQDCHYTWYELKEKED